MIMYTAVSCACITVMAALVVFLVVKFCMCDRAEKIEFIKNFKKGKCAVIYVVAVPLFFIAALYTGKGIAASVFESISKSVYLVVLKYDVSLALINANVFFAAAMYLCLSLVIVNSVMITVSILHQSIWKSYRLSRFSHAKSDKCIVIGSGSDNLYIYGSCSRPKLIIAPMRKEAREALYVKGVSYQSYPRRDRLWGWLEKELKRQFKRLAGAGKKLNLIVNCDDEQENLAWCGLFLKFIEGAGEDVADRMEIYVFGDREFEDIYSKYEEKSKGCLHYVNEFRQIAVDFIDRFPLTEYMDGRHIDYKTSLLKPETEINVSMIGFGRTNQQIFLSMVANNQFLTADEGGNPVKKRVRYHLFDKLHAGGHKNLNHNYFRYRYDFFEGDEVAVNREDYLPLPLFPSTEDYRYLDVNDPAFYKSLESTLDFGESSLNYIVVSLGMDYASIDMANKIAARLKERNIGNTHVFVRIRDEKIFEGNGIYLDADLCVPFGSDKKVVYDYSQILREKFSEMAIMRNFIYDIERDMKHDRITEAEAKKSRRKWHTKLSSAERESNVYACLSLRSKLHLMGLDYCKADGAQEDVSEREYFSVYAAGDIPDFQTDSKGGAVAVRYPLECRRSRRNNLAVQEHARWNAFMIAKGFVPAEKERILTETDRDGKFTNGKNYTMRHHGNLTTFEGLAEFRKLIAARDGVSEEKCDVIKYDYQLLDGAWWLLGKNGYKIFKRRG